MIDFGIVDGRLIDGAASYAPDDPHPVMPGLAVPTADYVLIGYNYYGLSAGETLRFAGHPELAARWEHAWTWSQDTADRRAAHAPANPNWVVDGTDPGPEYDAAYQEHIQAMAAWKEAEAELRRLIEEAKARAPLAWLADGVA